MKGSIVPETVYVALGSNLGDRAAAIHSALHELSSFGRVEATSFLYETAPAYILDQPPFLNAVCRLLTELSPGDLLRALKQVEAGLGRVRGVRYGPRVVDLDILLYGNQRVAESDLQIPHPLLAERDFVLEPLADLIPDWIEPHSGLTPSQLLARLGARPLPRVMPVAGRLWRWGEKSRIMGILNVTDDSFSGDGLLAPDSGKMLDRVVEQAERFQAEGANCLDVGGQSTRPGHELVAEEEEAARIVPVIEALSRHVDLPISVDTFRSGVARAALDAGAHLVNDIWGLRYDARLAELVRERSVPLVVMHNRADVSDPAYRARVSRPPLPPGYNVVEMVRSELAQGLAGAQACGVPRWNLIPDPGIGFGKSIQDHLRLIRQLDTLAPSGYPLLFGPSRKGFIGKLLGGLAPEERAEGTAALCVLAVERGAQILRVHDVQMVARAVRMAEAVLHGANGSE